MGSRQESWRETFRALGESLIGVVQAELAIITETWARSGKELGKVAALVAAAAYLGLICLPTLLIIVLTAALYEALGWPLWGSALTVTGVVVLVIGVLGGIAQYLMKHRFESPVATIRNQVTDHRAWWNERILSDGEITEGETNETLESSD